MPDRISHIIQMLDGLPPAKQQALIARLTARDPALARRLAERHFGFDDLQYADDRGMRALIADIDRRVVLFALRGVDDAVLQRFVQNLSMKAGQQLVEDIDAIGPQRRSDVEMARRTVVRAAIALRDAGKLSIERTD